MTSDRPGLVLASIERHDCTWYLCMDYQVDGLTCPRCGYPVYRHAWTTSRYVDAPSEERQVVWLIKRPRMKCKACGMTFTPQVPGLQERHRVTDRLVQYVRSNIPAVGSMRQLAGMVGLQQKTLQQIVNEQERPPIDVRGQIGIYKMRLKGQSHYVIYALMSARVICQVKGDETVGAVLIDALRQQEHGGPYHTIIVPFDLGIASLVRQHYPDAQLFIPFPEFADEAGKPILESIPAWSHRGGQDHPGKPEMRKIATMRWHELKDSHKRRAQAPNGDAFWVAYAMKEELLAVVQQDCGDAFCLFAGWYGRLALQHRLLFSTIAHAMSKMKALNVELLQFWVINTIHAGLTRAERNLWKPGRVASGQTLGDWLAGAESWRHTNQK